MSDVLRQLAGQFGLPVADDSSSKTNWWKSCKERRETIKYKDVLIEIQRKWMVMAIVIGATGRLSPSFQMYLEVSPSMQSSVEQQMALFLGTAHVCRNILRTTSFISYVYSRGNFLMGMEDKVWQCLWRGVLNGTKITQLNSFLTC